MIEVPPEFRMGAKWVLAVASLMVSTYAFIRSEVTYRKARALRQEAEELRRQLENMGTDDRCEPLRR